MKQKFIFLVLILSSINLFSQQYYSREPLIQINKNKFKVELIPLGELRGIVPVIDSSNISKDSTIIHLNGIIYRMHKPINGVKIYKCRKVKGNIFQRIRGDRIYKIEEYLGDNKEDGSYSVTYIKDKEWIIFWSSSFNEGSMLYILDVKEWMKKSNKDDNLSN